MDVFPRGDCNYPVISSEKLFSWNSLRGCTSGK